MNTTGNRSLFNDSKGSTLIEIIVSVLIVGIAFVPLMIGLNTALNVNKQNEKELYAENVASNVIEVAKSYGTRGLALLAKNSSASGSSTSAPSTSGGTSGSGSSTSGSSTSGSSTSGGDISFTEKISDIFGSSATMSAHDGNTFFKINNIVSGTGKIYNATIKFDNGTTERPLDIQNDFSGYPQAGNIEQALFVTYSEDDLNWIIDQIVEGKELSVSKADLAKAADEWLQREMTLTIEKNESETDPETGNTKVKYIIKRAIKYSCKYGAGWTLNGELVFSDSSIAPNVVPSQVKEIRSYDPNASDFSTQWPKSCILTFSQLKYNGKNIDFPHGSDSITIRKEVDGELSVYALCENGDTLKKEHFYIDITGNDITEPTGSNLSVYTNLESIPTGCTVLDNFGTGQSGKKSKMKNITVKVKDEDGNEILTKTSTLIELE